MLGSNAYSSSSSILVWMWVCDYDSPHVDSLGLVIGSARKESASERALHSPFLTPPSPPKTAPNRRCVYSETLWMGDGYTWNCGPWKLPEGYMGSALPCIGFSFVGILMRSRRSRSGLSMSVTFAFVPLSNLVVRSRVSRHSDWYAIGSVGVP